MQKHALPVFSIIIVILAASWWTLQKWEELTSFPCSTFFAELRSCVTQSCDHTPIQVMAPPFETALFFSKYGSSNKDALVFAKGIKQGAKYAVYQVEYFLNY